MSDCGVGRQGRPGILQEERARNDIPLPPFPWATDGPMEMLQNGHKALAGWTGPGAQWGQDRWGHKEGAHVLQRGGLHKPGFTQANLCLAFFFSHGVAEVPLEY